MSGKFVRASSYRHVHGEQAKQPDCYNDLKISASGDGNYACMNEKFFAVPITGGGGPVAVGDLGTTGRISNPSKICVHKQKVIDCQFSPLNNTLLGTAGEDCVAAVTAVPTDGKAFNITTPLVALHGHQKKVTNLAFHTTADNILATGSADHTVKIWDVEAQAEALSFEDHKDAINSIQWNQNGNLLLSSSKDHTVKLFDPRAPAAAQSFEGHAGNKKTSALFLNGDKLLTVGFTKRAGREIKIWDTKNLAAAANTIALDQTAGVLIAHYDPDNSVLYLGGKGDSSVKYYEIVDTEAFFLSEFRDTKSQKGLCFANKRACNPGKTEIARCLRVMKDGLVPVSFQVPRKSEMFQKDLYPDTYAGVSCMTAAEYLGGKDATAPTCSMKPGEAAEQVAKTLVAKKSPAELTKELEVANARIVELEALVAKLQAK